LLADAKAQGADCVVTVGGIQSNHTRATAVAARYLGLDAHLVLRTSRALVDADPGLTGNLLVERLAGAHVHLVRGSGVGVCFSAEGGGWLWWNDDKSTATQYKTPHNQQQPQPTATTTTTSKKKQITKEEYAQLGGDALGAQLVAQLTAAGHKPYFIPVGGSSSLGCYGYLEFIEELRRQSDALGWRFDDIVMACGSGGTTAGVALGNHLSGYGARVTAYGVRGAGGGGVGGVVSLARQGWLQTLPPPPLLKKNTHPPPTTNQTKTNRRVRRPGLLLRLHRRPLQGPRLGRRGRRAPDADGRAGARPRLRAQHRRGARGGAGAQWWARGVVVLSLCCAVLFFCVLS
jgi:hypothetical protein